jgi:hypothetical protein
LNQQISIDFFRIKMFESTNLTQIVLKRTKFLVVTTPPNTS